MSDSDFSWRTEVKIPFGFKRITGQSQKGDGKWDGAKFRKVKKDWPMVGDDVVIRKCEVVQTEIPQTCTVCGEPEPCSHDFDKTNRQLEEIGRTMGTKTGRGFLILRENVRRRTNNLSGFRWRAMDVERHQLPPDISRRPPPFPRPAVAGREIRA